ncbi:hypothetical protein F4859DRAFT_474641 [Xylaria cf. heliscus]|nr:hypothetical protein F4859DRAFT_474641 [Xylaria cf. heliscus]
MAQTTGPSISTIRTTWASSTSYLVVDIYNLFPDSNGVVTTSLSTEEWWTFPNTESTSSSPATLTQSHKSPHALTTPIPTEISTAQPVTSNLTSGSTSHTANYSTGLSKGAVAGISIATALLGAFIGVIASLILARRDERRKYVREYITYSDREKEHGTSSTMTDRLQLDQFLLHSTPDTTIANELRGLDHLIQQHVESHYHSHSVQMESSQLCEPLANIGIERGNAPAIAKLASLALEPRTRSNAIKYVIAKAAFECTVIGGDTCVSLLPPLVSGLSSIFPPVEDDVGNQEATDLALVRWRQLSAFLLHPDRSQRTPLVPSEDVSTQQAQELTVSLNRFLEPFISRDREERYEQENHLREVIAECAAFGYVLFSQPCGYRFRFESSEGPDTIVVCPGLDKVTDERGCCYKPPIPQIAAPVLECA